MALSIPHPLSILGGWVETNAIQVKTKTARYQTAAWLFFLFGSVQLRGRLPPSPKPRLRPPRSPLSFFF